MAWFVLARVLFLARGDVRGDVPAARSTCRLAVRTLAFGAAARRVWSSSSSGGCATLSVTHMLGALLGGALGLALARRCSAPRSSGPNTGDPRVAFLHAFVAAGAAVPRAGDRRPQGRVARAGAARSRCSARPGPQRRYKILDTSVIIDGRIADICETGFLDGTLVIPQFVLKELQLVADSADSLKRNRGRRGLDILQKIQKMAGVDVMISDLDFPEVREVDLKLIELARTLQGKIVTNDFNLNKVAQLRGVDVLNINELANSLKPVVLPGEIMKVFILKEGKEYNQGVAYLDDGTMVVVDNARKMIGKTIDVVVTSVLQTTAGKMIFGRFIDPSVAAAQAAGSRASASEPRAPAAPRPCRAAARQPRCRSAAAAPAPRGRVAGARVAAPTSRQRGGGQ